MMLMAIPAWTADGVLPPLDATKPVAPERSPYIVSLTDCVLRFSDTPERRAVLDGFLRYRAALHGVGLVQGFQWLDGSFLEDVERVEGRAPNDIDVVTFYRLPAGMSQQEVAALAGTLLQNAAVKTAFRVDGYLTNLDMDAERLARRSAYWYSVWAHRRTQLWKGFVQVDLSPNDDADATATLRSLGIAGGGP